MADFSFSFLAAIAARTSVVLLVLVVGVRLFGRRAIGGLNVYDLVTMLLLANAVQNAMTRGSGLLAVGLVSAAVLLLADHLLGRLFTRYPSVEARVVGNPTIIVQDGQLQWENLRREGVTEDEVQAAMRQYGIDDLGAVKLAVLEVDGSISVISRDQPAPTASDGGSDEEARPSPG